MKRLALILAILLASVGSVFAGDIYDEFREQLASIRDSYVTSLNMAIEDANSKGDASGWFWMRDQGLAATWKDLDFEPPESPLTVKEIPYGFRISGSISGFGIDIEVFVWTRDSDVQYTVTYRSSANASMKEVVREVFVNEQSDYPMKCAKGAVACYNGKSTFGKLKKKR